MKTIKEKLAIVKEVLKVEARELSSLKIKMKEMQRSGLGGREQCLLRYKRHEWRHKFIAYCLVKGRTLNEIEGKCREGNEPNQQLVDRYREEFTRND